MARRPLEWAYKNDSVSSSVFSKPTLRKYAKKGLLKLKGVRRGREVYWLTKKGLKCYRGELPKRQCKVGK